MKIRPMEESSSEFSDEEQNGYEAMMYLAKEKQRAQNPSLVRQGLSCGQKEEQIKVGSFYEVDHSKLSPKSPEQLHCIRIVMVNDKTSVNVSLRFPSTHSLRTHFREESYSESALKKLPALDEKYVMALDVAAKVLLRRIPSQEMDERGNFWSFWSPPTKKPSEATGVVSNRDSCLSLLRFNGVQWGKKRQVRFLNRHEEQKLLSGSLERTNYMPLEEEEAEEKREDGDNSENNDDNENDEDDKDDDEDDDDDDDEDDNEEEKEEEEEEEVEEKLEDDVENEVKEEMVVTTRGSKKRKLTRKSTSKTESSKKTKRSSLKQKQTTNPRKHKKKLFSNSIERWSEARYKLAEENMLKIMKEKRAFFGNPILRPALRAEARKLIGDTGLLDHLLKHMAGKLAPGGGDRFRRRHNSDGAMEYWIERSDLENIRKQAGVKDHFWVPPPGWKPGDNPLQDPISARQIESLKKEISKLKKDPTSAREIESLRKEMSNMKKNLQELISKNEEEAAFSIRELKRIKEEVAKMKREMDEISFNRPKQDLGIAIHPNTMLITGQSDNSVLLLKDQREVNEVAEDKATKIERLKSGFRICKPRGSFLWPSLVSLSDDPQSVVVPQDGHDPLVVPSPPSASSTSAPPGSRHVFQMPQPPSPVKPLAEKRPIKPTTLFTVSKETSFFPVPPQPQTPNSRAIINLNEAPKYC